MTEDPTVQQPPDVLARILLAAATHPTRPALSGAHSGTLRYRDLAVAIVSTAKLLRYKGFGTGDRLLNGIRPSPAAVVLTLGTIAAGGTAVLPEPGAAGGGFATAADLSLPQWAAADSTSWATGIRFGHRSPGWHLAAVDGRRVRTVRHGGWLPGVPSGSISTRSLARGRESSDEPLPDLRVATDAAALILFNSSLLSPEAGSGGTFLVPDRPRGVLHTRGSFGVDLVEAASCYGMDQRSEVYLDDLAVGLSALAVGAHWRLPPPATDRRIDAARFTKGIGRATHIHLAPADLAAVLGAVSTGLAGAPKALRHILVTGASVPADLAALCSSTLPHVRLAMVYGAPEIYPIAVGQVPAEPGVDGGPDLSVELLAGVSARTADGELTVGGPALAVGYLDGPTLTEYSTGDLALLLDRRVVLRGRRHHVIRRGGTTIDPEVYQARVESLPGVGHAALLETTDDEGRGRMILVVQPAGQPVNGHPLAGEPKASNSRDDDEPDAPQISALLGHPLATAVAAGLPGIVGAGSLPEQIVVLSAIPVGPDGRLADRAALVELVATIAGEDAGARPDGRRSRRGRLKSVRTRR